MKGEIDMLEGMEGQILEMLLLAVVLCCILIGSNRGLILGLYDMVKNLIIIAATIGIASVVVRKLPETMVGREGVAYLIAFFVSIIIINLVGKVIKIVDEIPIANALNKLGGAIFGAVTGIFLAWSILAILGAFQDYEWCRKTVESARENNVVMWFQNCNPIPGILKNFDFPVL